MNMTPREVDDCRQFGMSSRFNGIWPRIPEVVNENLFRTAKSPGVCPKIRLTKVLNQRFLGKLKKTRQSS
jgi:hypothetical protein